VSVMKNIRSKFFVSCFLLSAALCSAPATAATFDGEWSVHIASSNTACTNGASVSIGINDGRVASSNAAVTATGRVADAGAINVTLTSGLKRAVGFGRLSGSSGSGTWRAALCSGTWTAQKM
jgi:uncharacterized lipoprotein YajG